MLHTHPTGGDPSSSEVGKASCKPRAQVLAETGNSGIRRANRRIMTQRQIRLTTDCPMPRADIAAV